MSISATIAVGVDSSWAAAGAVDWALEEGRIGSRPVKAIHVVDAKPAAGPYFAAPGVGDGAKRLAAEVTDYLAGHGGQAGHGADVLTGAPARTLAHAAEGFRMLVVGRHGHGMLERLLIGSTAEAVAYEAKGPVVVVPAGWLPGDRTAPIVVGVDESELCQAAIEFAVGLAAERHAPVRLVHVWDVVSVYTWDVAPASGTIAEWRDNFLERLERTAQLWRDKYPEVKFETDVRRGHPVYDLADAADDMEAQLLVLGGRNHNRLAAMLLGSTARGILHQATCPIAIVHEPRVTL
ncbi:universal stress protein [Kribbella qitaiheensis]|uniref:Universal stress protein n=1 Tax=Kribbella qitaiheensis TaxID=1544730 RepID=A0A7G6WSJ3_9ACTN|nr:universal stress protein [Kribbella qitaiheensis]QNE16958.1 universal stress protein [Kribbella qitaiheensis]